MAKAEAPERTIGMDDKIPVGRNTNPEPQDYKVQVRNTRPPKHNVEIDESQLPKATNTPTGFDYPMGSMEPRSPIGVGEGPPVGYDASVKPPVQPPAEWDMSAFGRRKNIYRVIGESSTM